jgi:tetratricopeptide (TPR) repeat protein
MYLRGSKWSMQHRRPRINWFLVILVIILIAIVAYLDRFILPKAQTPFTQTATATRDPESFVVEANNFFSQGKLQQSIDTYLEAIRIKPNDPSLYISLARVQIFNAKYDEALINAENALLLNPNNSQAYAVRAWALTQKSDYVKADDSLKQALQLDHTSGIAQAYKAFLYGKMYENNNGPYLDPITTAIESSKAAINLAPNSLEAHWARAYIYQLTSNPELAVQEYKAAIQINPNISEIHLALGVTYRGLGVIDLAIQEYTLANTYNPSDTRPSLYSSRALASAGEFGQAAQYAESAVSNSPSDPYLRGNWGYMLYKSNDYPGAASQFSYAINGGQPSDGVIVKPLALTGDDAWIAQYYSTYAILLAQMNRCSEVLPLTQLIQGTVPNDSNAVYNAGFAEQLCAKSLRTPSSPPAVQPTHTPGATPTP